MDGADREKEEEEEEEWNIIGERFRTHTCHRETDIRNVPFWLFDKGIGPSENPNTGRFQQSPAACL
jgi:hypothetical protein